MKTFAYSLAVGSAVLLASPALADATALCAAPAAAATQTAIVAQVTDLASAEALLNDVNNTLSCSGANANAILALVATQLGTLSLASADVTTLTTRFSDLYKTKDERNKKKTDTADIAPQGGPQRVYTPRLRTNPIEPPRPISNR